MEKRSAISTLSKILRLLGRTSSGEEGEGTGILEKTIEISK